MIKENPVNTQIEKKDVEQKHVAKEFFYFV